MNKAARLLAVTAVLALSAPAWSEERQTTQPAQEQQKTEAPADNGATAAAPAPAAPATTMKDLLAAGYEVKAVSVIPHDIVKRGGSTTDVDATMFFLQKGTQAATCYTDFTSYANGSFYTLACTEYK